MNIKELLTFTHQLLKDAQIDHALIGGVAMGFHGVHRFTNDVDFLISGEERLVVKELFLSHGFQTGYETEEVLQLTGIGNLDVLFANRSMSRQMLKNAEWIEVVGVKCLRAEDIIGLKIQAYSNNSKREFRDKADIQSLIENKEKLDWSLIKKYADAFGEWEEITRIKERVKLGVD